MADYWLQPIPCQPIGGKVSMVYDICGADGGLVVGVYQNWNHMEHVEFQYGGRLGEFNGMSPQSYLTHCRVLPSGELNVMISDLCVTLQNAATRRIQWHVIPEPRIILQGAATWWIHTHDSRATCHIAGCSHLAKSMSWSCHIAWCNNSIRHIEIPSAKLKIVFRHIFIF